MGSFTLAERRSSSRSICEVPEESDIAAIVPFVRRVPPYIPFVTDIKAVTRDELAARFAEWQEPAYRLDQVLKWIYQQRVVAWDAMTNLPKPLRQKLGAEY